MRKIFIISIILFSITIVILTLKLIKSINNKEIKQMFSIKVFLYILSFYQ